MSRKSHYSLTRNPDPLPYKIREFRSGDRVTTKHPIYSSREGDIRPGTPAVVLKVVCGHAPHDMRDDVDEFWGSSEFDEQTPRESRGHTQLVKVKFPHGRIMVASGAYFQKVRRK